MTTPYTIAAGDWTDPRPDVTTLPGRDHRSLLLFLQTVAANNAGRLARGEPRMTCKHRTHETATRTAAAWESQYGTRYDDGRTDPLHDDWDCFDELENWGFIENRGTGMQPLVSLTPKGHAYAVQILQERDARNRAAERPPPSQQKPMASKLRGRRSVK